MVAQAEPTVTLTQIYDETLSVISVSGCPPLVFIAARGNRRFFVAIDQIIGESPHRAIGGLVVAEPDHFFVQRHSVAENDEDLPFDIQVVEFYEQRNDHVLFTVEAAVVGREFHTDRGRASRVFKLGSLHFHDGLGVDAMDSVEGFEQRRVDLHRGFHIHRKCPPQEPCQQSIPFHLV